MTIEELKKNLEKLEVRFTLYNKKVGEIEVIIYPIIYETIIAYKIE